MSNERSKYLSYLLRHKPEAANLNLDREGWCALDQLFLNTDFTSAEIFQIVTEDEKQRYAVSPSQKHIRANQGHSTTDVQMSFKTAVPPVKLFHGADISVIHLIMKHGLRPMNRHYVHLSADIGTAQQVGGRRKSGFAVLEIDTKTMLANGYKFFISENGVWLVDAVPAVFIKELP